MKLAHLLVAGTALVSASALAAGDQKDAQAKGSQGQQSMESASRGSSSQAASSQQHEKETVKQVQQKLSQEGIDVGPVDGIMGPKTQAGLKEYQQKNQLEATGQLNQETLAELGVEAGGSSSVGASSGAGSTRDAQPELKSRDAETRSIGEKFPSSQGSSQGSQGQQQEPKQQK